MTNFCSHFRDIGIFLFMYVIQHCFICRPSDSTVSEDAGIEPTTVATDALTTRLDRLTHDSARSHDLAESWVRWSSRVVRASNSPRSHPRLGQISFTNSARSHPLLFTYLVLRQGLFHPRGWADHEASGGAAQSPEYEQHSEQRHGGRLPLGVQAQAQHHHGGLSLPQGPQHLLLESGFTHIVSPRDKNKLPTRLSVPVSSNRNF